MNVVTFNMDAHYFIKQKNKKSEKVSHLYQDKKDHKKLNPNKWSVIQVVLTFYDVIIVGNIVAREKAK